MKDYAELTATAVLDLAAGKTSSWLGNGNALPVKG